MIIMNSHNKEEMKPNDVCAYEARDLREAIALGTLKRYSIVDIFLDILKNNKGPMKREMLISYFASREYCTYNCAMELFNRARSTLLLHHEVAQPIHGYYCLEEFM